MDSSCAARSGRGKAWNLNSKLNLEEKARMISALIGCSVVDYKNENRYSLRIDRRFPKVGNEKECALAIRGGFVSA